MSPARPPYVRAVVAAATALAVTVPLVALASAAPAGAAPTSAAVRVAMPTTVTVTPSATSVQAGHNLKLKIVVTGAGAGTATVKDGARTVDTAKVSEGRAVVVVQPSGGPHSYVVSFTPKQPDRWLPSTSTAVAVTGAAATSVPLAKGAYGPLVTTTQQRLAWAGILVNANGRYNDKTVAAVKRFQGKFFLRQTGVVNKRTMDELKRLAVKRPPAACRTVSVAICVDKTRKIAQLVKNGKVVISLDARFGSTSSPGLATREGTFSIQRKAVTHISSAYHTSMPYSMFFSGGQAVHYSQYFAADGYSGASHGCVNIRDLAGIKKMYAQAPIGTRVYVYRS